MPRPFAEALYGTIAYEDVGDVEAWSEGYWLDTESYFDGLRFLRNEVYPGRRGLMARDCRAIWFRVSNTAIRGDSRLERVLPDEKHPPTFNLLVGVGDVRSMPLGNVVYARLETTDARVRSIRALHAIPSDILNLTTDDSNRALIGAKANQWKTIFRQWTKKLEAHCGVVAPVPGTGPVHLTGVMPVSPGTTITGILPDTSGVFIGYRVVGTTVPPGTRVSAFTSNSITMTKPSVTPYASELAFDVIPAGPRPLDFYPFYGQNHSIGTHSRYAKTRRPFDLFRGRRPYVCPAT